MPAPPEMSYTKATPAQVLERLDIFRDQFLLGLHSAEEYNEILKEFQFKDDEGTTWSPGANTSQWYRWEGGRWIAAAPPAELNLPALPMMFIPVELPQREEKKRETKVVDEVAELVRKPVIEIQTTEAKTFDPPSPKILEPVATQSFTETARVTCPACGRLTTKDAFCSQCGASLKAERRCPKCDAVVPAGKRFCTNDGTPIPE